MKRITKVFSLAVLVMSLAIPAATVFNLTTGVAEAASVGWMQDDNGWWYQTSDNGYYKNEWQLIDDNWYHFQESGYMSVGWIQDGELWYYLNPEGDMATGWLWYGGEWYHLAKENYTFDEEPYPVGAMCIGPWWFSQDDITKEYYFDDNGVMQADKWIYLDYELLIYKWAYYGASGEKQKGWFESDGDWYALEAYGGYMLADCFVAEDENGNLFYDDGYEYHDAVALYYCGEDGKMQYGGWKEIYGQWYYLQESGVVVRNAWVGDYYLGRLGEMLTDQWIDDEYYVGTDGKWVPNEPR